MRKALILTILATSLQSISAQQELDRANTYFERAFYSDAIPLYEQLLPGNRSLGVLKNLADSYYRTFDMHSAARWYRAIVSKHGQNIDASYYFRLNQSLKAIGKYQEADKVLMDFYSKEKDLAALEKLRQDIRYLDNISAIGNRFDIKNLSINTATSEFGAALIDSNLIYTAAGKKDAHAKKIYRWNNQSYLDIYFHPIDKIDQNDSFSKGLSGQINTKMHEGTFAITKDRKTLYFTRNNFIKGKKGKDSKKISNLKIYRAEWSGNEWGNVTELPFNSDGFSTEHPALNHDETKLYFSSDRPGGHGSFDLYSASILPDGFYGNPINLGGTINTDKKEQFPHLDVADNLYFASNGHPGFGLLDIFISKYESGAFKKPDNLGLPVNSGYDDFSIAFHSQKEGFFSSNRPNGKGSDDIYSFVETAPLIIEECQQFIVGTLTDEITNRPIANGTVQLLDKEGNILNKILTDEKAMFNVKIDCDLSYTIHGSQEGYQDNSRTVMGTKEHNKVLDGSLKLLPLDKIEKQEEEEQRPIVTKEDRIDDIINKESAIVKENDRVLIKTDQIHFDYNLWYMRRESRDRLEVVVKIMQQYPEIVLEIGTHTDIRGSKSYNEELSQKRADAVKEHLISRGIHENRLAAKGYGESRPIIKCRTEDECTEEDHEWNRRCEFVIIKWE